MPGKGARSGFTLLELLVVMAIVAVLAGLLLPAVGAVRTAARSAVCGSQFRQIGMGVLAYANDWDSLLPPGYFQACSPPGVSIPAGSYAAWCDSPWVGAYVEAPALINGEPMSGVAPAPWRCPADRGRKGPACYPRTMSYGLNLRLCTAFGALPGDWTGALVPLARLSRTSALLLGTETCMPRWASHMISAGPLPEQGVDEVAWAVARQPDYIWSRHRQRSTFLFADGHVQLRGNPHPELNRSLWVTP
jgi:prepilin-type N-terminal cleavage/methylation domain-containing protein/prepilin-type processing-associated H-X9-DG protein